MNDQSEFPVILDRALKGDLLAMSQIAECYADGNGVPRNAKYAIRCYHQAARKGNVDAMFERARCYGVGIGVVHDLATARKWSAKAYDSDHLIRIRKAPLTGRRAEVEQLLMNFDPPT